MADPLGDPRTADVSVRVAWADDAADLARVQAVAWAEQYADLLPPVDPAQVAAGWEQLLVRPPDARIRVLVALERNTPMGFVLTAPASDPDADAGSDGELLDLTIHPAHRGRGHGSRLMQAGVDTLVADGFATALTWVMSTDDDLRRFFTESGWAADGAHRELDLDGTGATTVRQIRLRSRIR